GLRQMTFACSARTKEQSIFPPRDESASRQIEDQAAIHLGVEVKVEIVERFLRIAKLSLLATAIEQTLAASGEFITNQAGDEIDGRHGLGLCLMQPGFQHSGYTAKPELAQCTLQFNHIHSSLSFVLFSMRSR